MALCAAVTLLIPETKGKTIDEIEHGVIYGESRSNFDDVSSSGETLASSANLKNDTVENVKAKELA